MSDNDDGKKADIPKELKNLRRSRGGHRAFATKVVKESETIFTDSKGEVVTGTNRTEIINNAAILEEKLNEIRKLDQRILDLIEDDDEYEKEMVSAGEYNRSLSRVLVGTSEALGPAKDVKPSSSAVPVSDSARSTKLGKLPKVNIPTFDGDPLKFKTFWDTFECVVHNESSIDDLIQFTYLRDTLERRAKLALDGLTLTKENY